jgi:sugar (pentulose or hexulose) kinase
MSAPLVLGLDIGTTAVKAAVIDGAGNEVSHGRAPTPWRTVNTGAELDPDELVRATIDAADEALGGAPAGAVIGVGVASLAETGVLLDATGRPVVPSIAWHDVRGAEEAQRVASELPAFSERTGLPATPLCTLAKYAWMRAHWPASRRGVRWMNIAEWIVRELGGDARTEASLASRTGFYDLHTHAPWQSALAWADAPDGLAPPPTPAGVPLGHVTRPGRLRGAVLAVAGHDHVAAAVGAAATREGDVLDSCGTAEAIQRPIPPLTPELVKHAVAERFTVGWHALEGHHVLQGAVWAGGALHAVLDLVGVQADERDELEAAALDASPAGLAVHGFDDATLTVAGVTRGVSPAALYRATLEAIGAQGAAILARMAAVAGPPRRLVVTGGWAEGPAARAVKARHLGPFEHSPTIFTGCRGAALIAGKAAGLWPSLDAVGDPRPR